MKSLCRFGRRGLALLAFAALDFAWGLRVATVDPSRTSFYAWLHSGAPLWVFSVPWFTVGFACLVGAFCRNKTASFMSAMFIKIFWAMIYFLGWMLGFAIDGWTLALTWFIFAMAVAIIAGIKENNTWEGETWIPR